MKKIIIAFILIYSGNIVCAAAKKETRELKLIKETLLQFKNSEPTNDRIADLYDITGNSSIEEADIILFGESHVSPEAITLNYQTIARWAKPGDTILIESHEAGQKIDCNGYIALHLLNAQKKMGLKQLKEIAKQWDSLKNSLPQDSLPFPHSRCLGWENMRLRAIVDQMSSPVNEQIWDAQHAHLSPKQKWHALQKERGKPWVADRNEYLIKALAQYYSKKNKIFASIGVGHLPIDGFSDCTLSLPQYTAPLLKFLQKKKYVILTEKHLRQHVCALLPF